MHVRTTTGDTFGVVVVIVAFTTCAVLTLFFSGTDRFRNMVKWGRFSGEFSDGPRYIYANVKGGDGGADSCAAAKLPGK